MSGEANLDLDAILAEFHSQETAEPKPERAPTPRRRSQAVPTESGEPLSRPGRHAAPEPVAPPVETPRPAPTAQSVPRPAAPLPRPEHAEPPRRQGGEAEPSKRPARPAKTAQAARPAPRRKGRKGSLFATLLLLAALLAGLLFWSIRTEKKNSPPEPTPIRMELGEDLADYLRESAGNSRN